MTKENGSEDPRRVSRPNFDGSLDRGCLQVNDKAHPGLVDWANPTANAVEGYAIYRRRGNWSAWYSVCTPARTPRYAGIKCK